ncbi:hypothetical protein H310_10474 [Aphanomyces invadans]|uniref:Uncharacterized protein n=1 Tax=Aphanomyces invadans TaxID=157072 RepID=A0A024TQM0_9STRA|nr:hypothetical protein H310_10474 [Aphanomyces invadans]ETV96309.1 hypothetical protein H310_10474 [Aphanomyces invadans]|eukprot:XP_008875101.1 hypothetical protein H310_10474 [Aphanomyces invadans]
MATNEERYALVMGNSFPEFRFKPKQLDTANWTPARSIPSSDLDDSRSEDSRTCPHVLKNPKPVIMHHTKSPHHPSRHENPVALYSNEHNPSPLSLSRNIPSTHPASKKPSRRMSESARSFPHVVEAKSAALIHDPSPPIHATFNNQLPNDDLQIYLTKLGGRNIMDFLVHPGRELSRHVSGTMKGVLCLPAGISIICFPFHEASMLSPTFTFPVAALARPTALLTMAFSANHSRDTYELFAINCLGHLVPHGVLENQAATHDTFAGHPFVVRCHGSGRGFCIYAQDAAAIAKIKYSIVVDDNIPSLSFMATPKPAHVATSTSQPHATVCLSFFPR